MLRNYFLINILLVIMLGFLGSKLYRVVTYSMDVPSGAAVDEVRKKEDMDIRLKVNVPDRASFQIISGKNLFKPSRSSDASTGTITENTGRQDYPKLFATIIQDNNSSALMEDPGTKRRKMYQINDMIAGFLVSEIMRDKVILLMDNDKVVIKLREDKGIKAYTRKAVNRPNTREIRKSTRRRTVPAARRPARRLPPGLMSEEDRADLNR